MVPGSSIVESLRRAAAARATIIASEQYLQHHEEGETVLRVRLLLSTSCTPCNIFKSNRIHHGLSIAKRALIVNWMQFKTIIHDEKYLPF